MEINIIIFPPQNSRFFAISPPKVDSKKSVKYISSLELTIRECVQSAGPRCCRSLVRCNFNALANLRLWQGAFRYHAGLKRTASPCIAGMELERMVFNGNLRRRLRGEDGEVVRNLLIFRRCQSADARRPYDIAVLVLQNAAARKCRDLVVAEIARRDVLALEPCQKRIRADLHTRGAIGLALRDGDGAQWRALSS